MKRPCNEVARHWASADLASRPGSPRAAARLCPRANSAGMIPAGIADGVPGAAAEDRRPGRLAQAPVDVEAFQARGIRYAAVSFVDLHGKTKAKMVPIGHLQHAVTGSELFTGAALDGVPQEVSDEEVAAHPDLPGAIVLPWQPDVIWVPSNLYLQGAPFPACSRTILGQVVTEASRLGLAPQLGVANPCDDLRSLLHSFPLVDSIASAMNDLGWDVYSFDHEDGNGQFETDFSYTDVLRMADRFTFFRLMVGELARAHDCFATFMPKPFDNRTGSGAHFNMSMADAGGRNLFADADDPRGCGLAELGL